MKRTHLSFLIALLLVLAMGLAPPVNATSITAGNSSVDVVAAGLQNWALNPNTNWMPEEYFYVKVGGTVYALGALTNTITQIDTNKADVVYTGNGLTIDIAYTLTSSASKADIGEVINITNTNSSAITFLEYANFNMGNPDTGFIAASTDPRPPHSLLISAAWQYSGAYKVSETTAGPPPSGWEMGVQATVLNDSIAGALTNTPVLNTEITAPDLAWAFSWNVAADSSEIISKDKNLSVPVPASVLLLGSGLLGLVGMGWRRRKES